MVRARRLSGVVACNAYDRAAMWFNCKQRKQGGTRGELILACNEPSFFFIC